MTKKRVLIVEDDQDSLMALTAIVESLGYEPVPFQSGEEALKNIVNQRLDLALIDIMMPGLNGYQVLEKLRGHPTFQGMPLIFVTAKDADTELLEGYQAGADYYISKPFTVMQIEYGLKMFLSPKVQDEEE